MASGPVGLKDIDVRRLYLHHNGKPASNALGVTRILPLHALTHLRHASLSSSRLRPRDRDRSAVTKAAVLPNPIKRAPGQPVPLPRRRRASESKPRLPERVYF